ncbi:hypothetical protein H5410_043187 [Solanum commersonii]|uniref:Uncharacterized protein n=1 Tax=Solanum commersonii TaxID=4109 RepID=A0A9J5XWV2_SOLCO|nr:hypothetical protein H5410_043187 [Solanum commersonii]
MIFLLENSDIQQKKEPWKIIQRYFVNGLYLPEPIPNWFLNWWAYHGPTIKILPNPFLKLYKE